METENFIEDYNTEFQKIKEEIGQVILTPEDVGYLQFIGIAGKVLNYDVRKDIVRLIQKLEEI